MSDKRRDWSAAPPGWLANLTSAVHCCYAALGTPIRLARPLPADRRFLSSLTTVEPPAARRSVDLVALPHGASRSPRPFVVEGQWSPPGAAIGMTTFLVRHPEATFVIDPALCADTEPRVLRGMPLVKRALLGGGGSGPGLRGLLAEHGIDADNVDFALATHLHWDHISGVLDFPELPLRVCGEEAAGESTSATRRDANIAGLSAAVAAETFDLDGPPVLTFQRSHDVLGDGSVVAVALPGHSAGHVGFLVSLPGGRRVLLAGDTAWNSEQVRLIREKAPLPGLLADRDREETFRTLHRLHALPPEITVVPAHDAAAARPFAPGTRPPRGR